MRGKIFTIFGAGRRLRRVFGAPSEGFCGRLRNAGEDLYDIRRGWAAFGRFVGAGRRFREVSGPAGLG